MMGKHIESATVKIDALSLSDLVRNTAIEQLDDKGIEWDALEVGSCRIENQALLITITYDNIDNYTDEELV